MFLKLKNPRELCSGLCMVQRIAKLQSQTGFYSIGFLSKMWKRNPLCSLSFLVSRQSQSRVAGPIISLEMAAFLGLEMVDGVTYSTTLTTKISENISILIFLRYCSSRQFKKKPRHFLSSMMIALSETNCCVVMLRTSVCLFFVGCNGTSVIFAELFESYQDNI